MRIWTAVYKNKLSYLEAIREAKRHNTFFTREGLHCVYFYSDIGRLCKITEDKEIKYIRNEEIYDLGNDWMSVAIPYSIIEYLLDEGYMY